MTNGELMKMLFDHAKEYRDADVNASISRNSHMNRCRVPVDQDAIDAVLVDFVNFVGMKHGMDFGSYTRDLEGDPK